MDAIIELQEVLIDLLQRYYLERLEKEFRDILRYPIERLEVSQRYLMRSNIDTEKAKQEMELASKNLELQMEGITNKRTLEWTKKITEKIQTLTRKIS